MDYHADRFTDFSFIVRLRGEPIALFPASSHGREVVSHGGLTFGGFLSGPELTTTRAVAALEAVATALRADGADRLVYKPVPHIYHVAPAEEDLYALHAAGAILVTREVSAAVLPGSSARYSNERRRAIVRAQRAGVVVAEDDQIEDYMLLLRDVLRERHDVDPTHTPDEMRLLNDRFPANIRLFTARLDREMLSGVLVYETARVAHAQYIAAGARGREMGANDVVFDHLLGNVYRDKCFDFGISNQHSGDLNEGLMRNKEGFGARAIVHDHYLLELA
jgi:Acetyltransferase (GNAT) domain